MYLSEVHELLEAGQRSPGKDLLIALWMLEQSQEI